MSRFLPTLPQWLGILILAMLTTTAWRTALVASDGDTCMHWRVGEWMLQHHQIIRHDEFSHTRFGAPVISKEWIAELIFALAGRLAGLTGIALVAALLIATTFALLLRQLLREHNDLLVAGGVTLLAMWAATGHWLARPHLFSLLFLFCWNDALRRFERDQRTGRLLILLTLLTVLWVNVHGGYLAGFLVLGAYWLGAVLERNWPKLRTLTMTGVLCAAASLLNPNGYRLHLHNLEFLRSQFLTGWLAEYASTNFHSAGAIGVVALLAAIFFTFTLARPRLSASAGVLLLSWLYFALYSGRNVPLLAILSAPILASAWTPKMPARWHAFSERVRQTSEAGNGWLAVVVTLVIIGFSLRPTVMPSDAWPVKAVEYIQHHPQQFTGNMFNQYMWGGYLMEVLPEHKTFVDGRTDFFGEGLIREFSDTTALKTNWTDALVKYDVSWVLMPQAHRLNLALPYLPGWSCVYSDNVAAIWSKTP